MWFACLVSILISKGVVLTGEDHDTGLRSFYPVEIGLTWEYLFTENMLQFLQQVECSLLPDLGFVLCTKSNRQTQYIFKFDKGFVKLAQIKVCFPYLPWHYSITVKPDLPVFKNYVKIGDNWRWDDCFYYS